MGFSKRSFGGSSNNRLGRHSYPAASGGGFDVVVQVRRHRALPLDAYREMLGRLVGRAADALGAREGDDARA